MCVYVCMYVCVCCVCMNVYIKCVCIYNTSYISPPLRDTSNWSCDKNKALQPSRVNTTPGCFSNNTQEHILHYRDHVISLSGTLVVTSVMEFNDTSTEG